MPALTQEPSSYRDRSNKVYYIDNDVYRALDDESLSNWLKLESTRFFKNLISQNKITRTKRVEEQLIAEEMADWPAHLKHEAIPFISYPYEWSFSMLKDAALLHLELIDEALGEEFILKDASSYNIQWSGTQPVFIDIPSFIPYRNNAPWIGYKQFCELFLYPLILTAHKNINFQPWLRGSLEGISAEELSNLMCAIDYLNPTFLTNVYLTAKFQSRYNNSKVDAKKSLATHGFTKQLIQNNVRRLQSQVSKLKIKSTQSTWSAYAETNSYSTSDDASKKEFVEKHLSNSPNKLTWDLGCNTGEYSKIAAKYSGQVVALDADPWCIDLLYQNLKQKDIKNVLPLVIDITDPSPNIGWLELERKSISKRKKPDTIICLALIHHIIIANNIPLIGFISWLRDFNSILIIEFVTKDDPMTQKLLRNKDDQHDDYTIDNFEASMKQQFHIMDSKTLQSRTRKLYFAKPI